MLATITRGHRYLTVPSDPMAEVGTDKCTVLLLSAQGRFFLASMDPPPVCQAFMDRSDRAQGNILAERQWRNVKQEDVYLAAFANT